jgi:hypothetical protein
MKFSMKGPSISRRDDRSDRVEREASSPLEEEKASV